MISMDDLRGAWGTLAAVSGILVVIPCVMAACDSSDATDAAAADGGPPAGDDALPDDDDNGVIGQDGGTDSSDAATTDLEPAEPLDLSDVEQKKWSYFEIPGAYCRDGSKAGFSVNLNSASKKLMIYLQWGGACLDAASCADNRARIEEKSISTGIFTRSNAANPVAEWNHVFVPYCTGDVHSGSEPDANVPGVGPQKFVGYDNMDIFLRRLRATFPDVQRILLAGSSAGGYGAVVNYGHTMRVFPDVPVNLIDDAAPFFSTNHMPACAQNRFATTFGWSDTVLHDCGTDCANQRDIFTAITKHWARTVEDRAQGLVTSLGDSLIRQSLGINATCTSQQEVSASQFAAAIEDIAVQHAAYDNFGVYGYSGAGHMIFEKSTYFSATGAGGKTVASWVAGIVNDDVVANVGP